MSNEIVLYQSDELPERIEVKIDADTVWLNRQQLATLFGRDVKTIGKHINNIFKEGELVKELVVANFATTTQHGAIKNIFSEGVLQKEATVANFEIVQIGQVS